MNDQIDPTTARGNARRRLVRGAFAAPAVMTLVSGRALAATSAVMCVKNQVTTSPTIPAYPASASTIYLKVQRYKKGNGQNPQYWVKGSDIVSLAGGKSPSIFVSSTQFVRLAGGSSSISNSDPGSLLVDTGNYALVLVDQNGSFKAVQNSTASTGGLSAVVGTCWASFVAA